MPFGRNFAVMASDITLQALVWPCLFFLLSSVYTVLSPTTSRHKLSHVDSRQISSHNKQWCWWSKFLFRSYTFFHSDAAAVLSSLESSVRISLGFVSLSLQSGFFLSIPILIFKAGSWHLNFQFLYFLCFCLSLNFSIMLPRTSFIIHLYYLAYCFLFSVFYSLILFHLFVHSNLVTLFCYYVFFFLFCVSLATCIFRIVYIQFQFIHL